MTTCSNCGTRLPAESRFCPDCGVRVAAENGLTAAADVPPEETEEVAVNVSTAAPRYFGVTPPMALFALAVASLALAILVFVAGHVVAGALLLAAAVLFFALFVPASRRLGGTAVARVSSAAFVELRSAAGYAVEALGAQSRARTELLRLRREVSELVAQRTDAARLLGEAVYRGDDEAVASGRERMRQLDELLAAKEAEMKQVAAAAKERIQRAQFEAAATAVVEPPSVPEPTPVPSEPPMPAPMPEPTPAPSPTPAPIPPEAE